VAVGQAASEAILFACAPGLFSALNILYRLFTNAIENSIVDEINKLESGILTLGELLRIEFEALQYMDYLKTKEGVNEFVTKIIENHNSNWLSRIITQQENGGEEFYSRALHVDPRRTDAATSGG